MYQEKNQLYFENVRTELLDLIPNYLQGKTVLELGAGAGETLLYAKQNNYASKVIGYELCALKGSTQYSAEIDKFIIGDIEQTDFDEPDNSVDVIICGDVLEHLREPAVVLHQMKRILKKDGVIISSLPNFRHYSVMAQIYLKGSFYYQEEGILDKTHLRFFCKKNMIELYEEAGYKLCAISANPFRKVKKVLNILTFKFFEEFLTHQYHIIVKPI